MKRIIGTALFVLILTSFLGPAYGQIPNPGFETWTGTVGFDTPTGWITGNIPGYSTPITKSTDARSGSAAVRGDVVSVLQLGLYPPWIWSFFHYAERPGALTGYYKFTSVSHDSLAMFVILFQGSLSTVVASGEFGTSTTVTSFTKFSLPLEYHSTITPDSAWFEIITYGGQDDSLHLGTFFVVDDIAFEGTATAVGDQQTKPASFALAQNYPNPFNPETSIRYDLPEEARVHLAVYNPLGQKIATLVDEQEPSGSYQVKFNASTMPSGMYFYRLEAIPLSTGTNSVGSSGSESRNFVQTRKLLLLK